MPPTPLLLSSPLLPHLLLLFASLQPARAQGGANSAAVYSVQAPQGSMAGGTYLTLNGVGFERGGIAGQTIVYIGTQVCEQNQASLYNSVDASLVCWTPPAPFGQAGPQRVMVEIVAINGANTYAPCPNGGSSCQFTYSYGSTPTVNFASLGGSGGKVFKAYGQLLGATYDMYYVFLGGGTGGSGGATCDTDEALQQGASGSGGARNMVDGGGNGMVMCYMSADSEAGRYNMSLEVRSNAANGLGYGQPVWNRFAKQSFGNGAGADGSPSVFMVTLRAYVSGISYNASGLNGGAPLTITGSGFSSQPGGNTVTLGGAQGIPCTIISSSAMQLVCVPGAAALPSAAPAAGTFVVGGAGLLHAVYLLDLSVPVQNAFWGTFPGAASATFPPAIAPSIVLTNVDSLTAYFYYYGGAHNDYVEVLAGFFVPPATANYSFYVRGDDEVAVWLSTDATPAHQRLVAYTSYYNPSWWSLGPVGSAANTMVSAPQLLQAGAPYFFRTMHTQGGGQDWFDVAIRVHTAGNAAATAALASPDQATFRSVPSVQNIATSAAIVREMQTVTLTGATGGLWGLLQGGQPTPGSYSTTSTPAVGSSPATSSSSLTYLTYSATCSQVASAISGTGGCGSISCSKGTIPGPANTTGGSYWNITFNCPAPGASFPALSGYSVSLTGVAPTISAARVRSASTPLGGTFALVLDLGAGAGPLATTPLNYNAGAGDLVAALTALGAADVQAALISYGGYSSPLDASEWQVTFWNGQGRIAPLLGLASGNGTVALVGASAPSVTLPVPVTLSGAGAAVSVTQVQVGSADPFYWPSPMDWFRTALPVDGVIVTSNGLVADCDHVPNSTDGTPNAPILFNSNSSGAGACTFVYSAALTPSVSAATASSGSGLITAGTILTIVGAGFLPVSAGLGVGVGGANLTAGQLNAVTLVGLATGTLSACNVTAATASHITCTVVDTAADVYNVSVLVSLGGGLATVAPGAGPFTYAAGVRSVSPLSGSLAGGSLLTISGTGFSAAGANPITIGGQPCVVVAATYTQVQCLTPALVLGTSTAAAIQAGTVTPASVAVDGVAGAATFSYQAALTPLLTLLAPTQLSAATSGLVSLSLSNVAAGAVILGAVNASVAFGPRACSVKSSVATPAAGGTYTLQLQCVLLRTTPAAMPQAPLAPAVTVPGLGLAAFDESGGGSWSLDAGYRVASVSPSSGSMQGGSLITISGAGFTGQFSAMAVTFVSPSSFASYGAANNTVACTLVAGSVAADGSSLTCVLSRPSYETVFDFKSGLVAGAIAGVLQLTVNSIPALCVLGSSCGFSFLQSQTPVVSAITYSGGGSASQSAVTAIISGSLLQAPILVWFGTVLASCVSASSSSASCVLPVQTAGIVSIYLHCAPLGNAQVGDGFNYTFPLEVFSVAPAVGPGALAGSIAGGHLLAISGVGFSRTLARNVVLFDGALNGVVIAANETQLLVRTPPMASTGLVAWGGALAVPIGVYIVNPALYVYPIASIPAIANVSYSFSALTGAPRISTLHPTTATRGTTIVVLGAGFGNASSASEVLIGNAPCAISSWSPTNISCVVGDTPAGSHLVLVVVGTAGIACGPSSCLTSTPKLTMPLTIAAASTLVSGVGGGVAVTLSGGGFATPLQGGTNAVSVCGRPATVVGSTSTSLAFLSPVVQTGPALDTFATYEEAVLTGTPFGASGSLVVSAAFDGSVSTLFRACTAGIDLSASVRGVVTVIRFYPKFQDLAPFAGSTFWAANSQQGPWTLLWTAPSSVNEGWNYFDLTGLAPAAELGNTSAQSSFRYLQWQAAGGSDCWGAEVQFVGFALSANDGAACDVNVSVTTPSSVFTPAAVAAAGSLLSSAAASAGAFTYDSVDTPAVYSISPDTGTALGGTLVTLTGTGFGPGVTSVVLNGMPCAVQAATASSITCITSNRTSIMPQSVAVSVAGLGLALVNDTSTTYFSYLDRWSALTTWLNNEPPGPGDTVIVPIGQAILVDISPPELFLVLVQGELVFDPHSPYDLFFDAHYIFVDGGLLEVGTEAQPFLNNLTITLHGDRLAAIEIPDVGAKCLAVMNSANPSAMGEMGSGTMAMTEAQEAALIAAETDPGAVAAATEVALMVSVMGADFGLGLGLSALYNGTGAAATGLSGASDPIASLGAMSSDMPGVLGAPAPASLQGTMDIHGRPRLRVWTKVAMTAAAGSQVIVAAENVDFAPGETLVITSSSTDAYEAEVVVVASLGVDQRTITLTAPLAYEHTSSWYPAAQFGHSDADMRCEVGLLSRNVVIRGDKGSAAQLFGAHTGAFNGATYRIENVELHDCGQGFLLGRYCVHQHLGSDRSDSYVRANSIHDSFQRAVTIHATNYLRVQYNVAYNVRGHTFFVEDGVEQFNVIEGNLAALTVPSYASLRSDLKPASFWTSSPTNFWRHNVAAGCTHDGYWFEPPGNPGGPSFTTTICPVSNPLGQHLNNTAHSNGVHGMRIYPEYVPRTVPCNAYSASAPQFFYNFTAWHNGDHGIFGKRNGDLHHVFPKLIENDGDELNWVKFPGAGEGNIVFSKIANVVSALLVSVVDPVATPPWDKRALYLPQDEFFFVSGATFVNYGATAGAIAGCNMCNDVTGEFLAQGAYTYRFSGLNFVNTSVRTFWTTPPENDIFLDLDGSLSGAGANSTVVAHKRFNDWPECPRDAVGTFSFGNVCGPGVWVRRVTIEGVQPGQLDQVTLNVTGGAADGFPGVAWDLVRWLPREIYGYAMPLVTGHFYSVHFQSQIDWEQLVVRYSEPDYLVPGEFVGLTFDWISTRYRNRVYHYDVWADATAEVPSIAAGTLPTAASPFGTGNFPSGPQNTTWSVVLSTNLNGSSPGTGLSERQSEAFRLEAQAIQCAPWGCPLPPTGVLGPPQLWSWTSTWPLGVLPAAGSNVIINATQWVIMDVNPPPLGTVTVLGRLDFQDSGTRTLTAAAVVVWGALNVGSAAEPFQNAAAIALTGTRSSPSVIVDNNLFIGNKVLVVLGQVTLVGAPRAVSWVRLASTAAAGSSTVVLSSSVASSGGAAAWGPGDGIVLTASEYDAAQTENVIIAAVSADGLTLTLAAPLAFSHYAGPVSSSAASPAALRSTRLAAVAGLLTRNVVIQGVMAGPGDGYGGHVFVSEVTRLVGAGPATESFVGVLSATGVQFQDMGQSGMQYAAIDFQYGDFLLDASADDQSSYALADNPQSVVLSCSFSACHNYGVTATATRHLLLQDNVLARTYLNGIGISADSTNATIVHNLVAGNLLSPFVNSADQTQDVSPQAGIFLNGAPRLLANNYVSGAVDAAYTIRADDCAAATTYMSNNEAAGVLIGVFVLPTRTVTGCAWVSSFTVWKAAHIGILAMDQWGDFLLSSSLVSDSHIGVSLNFIVGKATLARSDLKFVTIVGSSHASTCAASMQCRAMTATDVTASSSTCGSVYGPSVRRIGLMVPQYTNRGKTCEADGTLPVCRPVNRPERLCGMPWESRYGLPSTQATQMFLHNVTFSQFNASDCGMNSAAVAWNPTQVDMAVPISATGIVWDAVPNAARYSFDTSALTDSKCINGMGCDGQNLILLSDLDGSLTGTPRSTVMGPNPALSEPSCSFVPEWPGIFCPALLFRAAILENMDGDRSTRRLGAVEVTRVAPCGQLPLANCTSMSMGPIDQECPMRFYFGQLPFAVLVNSTVSLYLPSTEPAQTRLHFISPDPFERVLFTMFITRPNSQSVFVNGNLIDSINDIAEAAGEPSAYAATLVPTMQSAIGSNLFSAQLRHIILTLGGGQLYYDIVRDPSIEVTLVLSLTEAQFFDPATVVTNLALLLGISPSQIKVVSVHADTSGLGRRLGAEAGARRAQSANASASGVVAGTLSGLQSVQVEIFDANKTLAVSNQGDASSVNASVAQQQRMVNLAATLTELASTGQLATIGSYAVASVTVVAPTISSAPGGSAVAVNSTSSSTISVLQAQKGTAAQGLASGAIAGIVIGSLFGLGLVCSGLMLVSRSRTAPLAAAAAAQLAMRNAAAAAAAAAKAAAVQLPQHANPNFAHPVPAAAPAGPRPITEGEGGSAAATSPRSSASAFKDSRHLSFRVQLAPTMAAGGRRPSGILAAAPPEVPAGGARRTSVVSPGGMPVAASSQASRRTSVVAPEEYAPPAWKP